MLLTPDPLSIARDREGEKNGERKTDLSSTRTRRSASLQNHINPS